MITECGMAMERSRCPECGAAVGGGDHQLLAGNAPATGVVQQLREAAGVWH